MICNSCGSKMRVDDKDIHFPGCRDVYWICPCCQTSCIEEIRYGNSYRVHWHSENSATFRDYITYPNGRGVIK